LFLKKNAKFLQKSQKFVIITSTPGHLQVSKFSLNRLLVLKAGREKELCTTFVQSILSSGFS
jgi:hypothetical protein